MLPAQKRNEILMMPWVNSACITCMQFLNLRIRKLFKLLQVLIFSVVFESLSWNSFERACPMIQRCWNFWSQKDQSCTFGTWDVPMNSHRKRFFLIASSLFPRCLLSIRWPDNESATLKDLCSVHHVWSICRASAVCPTCPQRDFLPRENRWRVRSQYNSRLEQAFFNSRSTAEHAFRLKFMLSVSFSGKLWYQSIVKAVKVGCSTLFNILELCTKAPRCRRCSAATSTRCAALEDSRPKLLDPKMDGLHFTHFYALQTS